MKNHHLAFCAKWVCQYVSAQAGLPKRSCASNDGLFNAVPISIIQRATSLQAIAREAEIAAMVIVGYGDFKGYRIEEVSDAFLAELAARYRLSHSAHSHSRPEDLQITIAVHEELQCRSNGRKAIKRELPLGELARDLVAKGFQRLSREFHPDIGGTNAAQERLNRVRSLLLVECSKIYDSERDNAVVIPDPRMQRFTGTEITDEDIPF